jgi:pimeloyl-ACP methyl ester carboxylesterase
LSEQVDAIGKDTKFVKQFLLSSQASELMNHLHYRCYTTLCVLSITASLVIAIIPSTAGQSVSADASFETVRYRNLTIDLGNGTASSAQLSFPAVGNGTYPGILLVHGSGATDMDETVSNEVKPLLQISQYLSERGYAVLRYDKRGIGSNATILNSSLWGNTSFLDLKNDAKAALEVLLQQPEVDPDNISLIGHSEGAMIVPRVAIDVNSNSTVVRNIVLMGIVAQNLNSVLEFQIVDFPLQYAREVLDTNHTGTFSVQDGMSDPFFAGIVSEAFANSTSDTIQIEEQLRPVLVAFLGSIIDGDIDAPCDSRSGCPVWLQSHEELEPTLDIIGNVSKSTGILLLNGEADSQTIVQQAFLLEQKLVQSEHPDHKLITYPGLGHLFSPSSKWYTEFGPIESNVLSDIHGWLSDHSSVVGKVCMG